jgi:AcrR family transcriptional regulator
VSVREIAKQAKANISMLNYYYGGKLGILRAIIDTFYDKYYSAVLDVDIKHQSTEEVIREVIMNLISFYRDNTELAVATHNAFGVDMPEIADLEMKWVKSRREQINEHFKKFGLDTSDEVTMTVMRGLLSSIIATHFINAYTWEHTKACCTECEKEIQEFVESEIGPDLTRGFYDKYGEKLTEFYLTGLYGITGKGKVQSKEGV